MAATTIRIREKDFRDNTFDLTITFRGTDGEEKETDVQLPNPNNDDTERLMEWYFEDYIGAPYDDVRAAPAVAHIKAYGTDLFGKLFAGDASDWYHTALGKHGPAHFAFEITGNSPAFQSLYWESLWDPEWGHPFAEEGVVFLRKQVNGRAIGAEVKESPTLNLLIVTARPGEEDDVNYRTIQRPLIDLIRDAKLRVRPHILRPGTYEVLVQHLDDKAGHYHVVHFDLHGGLLDYAAYRRLREKADKITFRPVAYHGGYALPELPEADFNGGTKAFLFFESEEKGTVVPVEARQLAAQLESKQIPICILNACQSAKQDGSAHETSLGRALIARGIQVVLAMRYSVSVTGAEVLMKTLYQQLYAGQPIEQAIAEGRRELYRNKDRRAAYNHRINLEDWLLPVVYQNNRPQLHLRTPTPQELEGLTQHGAVPPEARQTLEYGFFGRDLDILKIEKNLLVRANLLLLQGMGGAGKTTLLKYLADWWLRTGFVAKVFYFGYDVKAYSLNEILFHVAQRLYDRFKFATFTALLPEVQANEIVRELRAKRYALILDNTESITGEKLSIPNTLPPAERTALKAFLAQLKGGQSIVLIGSRSDEEWLKPGTFGNNQYLLQGLDHESATNFAHEILKENGLEVKTVADGPHFERLMKLLAGYPLALKAILPNLKRKTAKVILDDLQAGVGDLDKGNPQEKTHSIIKCIEYAHSNLSDDAQKLLLCLAPFQSVVNLEPAFSKTYFEELRKEEPFTNYPFHKLEEVVHRAVQSGLMQEVASLSGYKIMTLQPVFTYFLNNRLQTHHSSFKKSLQTSFITHYCYWSHHFVALLTSGNVEEQKRGEWLTKHEYENFNQVLNLLLEQRESASEIIEVVVNYLERSNEHNKRFQLVERVYQEMQKYEPQLLNNKLADDYLKIKNHLAIAHFKLNRFAMARNIWKELLMLHDNQHYIKSKVDLERIKAAIYHNLGRAAGSLKDYQEAKEYLQKSIDFFVQHTNIYKQGCIYQDLGMIAYQQQSYSIAEEYYYKALDIYNQQNDEDSQGAIYQNLGVVAIEQQRYLLAKEHLTKSLILFDHCENTHSKGRIYQNLAILAKKQDDFEEAEKYYHEALLIFVKCNDVNRQGQTYFNLGHLSKKRQKDREAKDYWDKALDIFVEIRDVYNQGPVYQNLGVLAQEQKDFQGAKEHYQKALERFLQFPQATADVRDILQLILTFSKQSGEIAFGKAMYEKALPYIAEEYKAPLQALYDDLDKP